MEVMLTKYYIAWPWHISNWSESNCKVWNLTLIVFTYVTKLYGEFHKGNCTITEANKFSVVITQPEIWIDQRVFSNGYLVSKMENVRHPLMAGRQEAWYLRIVWSRFLNESKHWARWLGQICELCMLLVCEKVADSSKLTMCSFGIFDFRNLCRWH